MQELTSDIASTLLLWLMLIFLWICSGGVVLFFLCRLLLALSKFFEARTKALRHDLALQNYHDED